MTKRIPFPWRRRNCDTILANAKAEKERLEAELAQERETCAKLAAEVAEATKAQLECMKTVNSFRSKYHDGETWLAAEILELQKQIGTLKKIIRKKFKTPRGQKGGGNGDDAV